MSTCRRLPGLYAVRRQGAVLALLLVAALAPLAVGAGSAVAGSGDGSLTVFVVRDVNGNGSHEPRTEVGVEGIGVEVTDGIGGISQAVTGPDGKAAVDLSPLTGGRYRVRTATPLLTKPYLQQTLVSLSSVGGRLAPATSFVDVGNGAEVTQTVGLWDPSDYVGPGARYVTTEQPRRWNGGPSPQPALVTFALGQRNTGGITTEATWDELGATYGLAFDRATRTVYVGALAKRHSGYGPGGGGAIYAYDVDTGALTPFGAVPDAAPTAHGADIGQDAEFSDVPGKEGLGDLELSPDGRSLFAVGLRARSLYRFPLDGGSPQVVRIPAPEGISDPEDWRPFALGTGNGKLYVGGVDSAQTSADPDDLAVTVYEATNAATTPLLQAVRFTPVLQGTIGGVLRGDVLDRGPERKDARTHWHPWSRDPAQDPDAIPPFSNGVLIIYPQPVLTDIEFDNEGSMLLGFRDRTSDQVGGDVNTTMSGGDLVKACGPVDGPWTIEYESDSPRCASNANPALDGNQKGSPHEFYIGEFLGAGHQETALGGLRVNKAAGDVASTSMDPAGRISTNGVGWYSQLTGQGPGNDPVEQNGLTLVSGATGFGKGNGLGDLELIVDQAPVQIGNYVWFDTDRDGAQDANEPPIEGVTVRLLGADGAELATTTTDAQGEYYFNQSEGLGPDTRYQVEFDWSTGTIFGEP
ncbi:MAG TPA: SdrD B-like domain-containing protein, partial [Pseudonocardiaceae bacterium]|nr:SdrD B-like domain-containing protein [Pseudonocardiaceae bacterium]